MKISFIVPVYNTPPEKLYKCIFSLLQVSSVETEIIVINDGSAVEFTQLYEAFFREKSCSRVHYIYQTNKGVSEARNRGISLASGEYIMMVDSDDEIIPDCFGDPYYGDFVLFRHVFIKGRKQKKILRSAIEGESRPVTSEELAWLVTCGKIRGSCGLLYRRDFLLSRGINYESGCIQGEDADFNFRLMRERPVVQYIRKASYIYRFSTETARSRWRENPEKMITSGSAQFEQALACLPVLFPEDCESRKKELISNRVRDIYRSCIDLCGAGCATKGNKRKIEQLMAQIALSEDAAEEVRRKYLDVVHHRWWKITIIAQMRQVYLWLTGV